MRGCGDGAVSTVDGLAVCFVHERERVDRMGIGAVIIGTLPGRTIPSVAEALAILRAMDSPDPWDDPWGA